MVGQWRLIHRVWPDYPLTTRVVFSTIKVINLTYMKYTIKDFNQVFPTDEACLEYMFNHRYGDKYPCPSCGKASWYKLQGRKAWSCGNCRYQIHPLAGTIFHKSETSLVFWFFAMFKFANSRNGVSALELQRDLNVTYKTAWRMAKQIRSLMDTSGFKLSGTVEVDEAFMGKLKDPKSRKGASKALGMVQRGGAAKAVAIHKVGQISTVPLVKSEVEPGSNLMTDMASVYRGKKLAEYNVNSVNHSKKEYAFGLVHTNSVEGFFSQIKRSLDGTYHKVSEKYLQSYLDEFSFRLSYSRSEIPLFLILLGRACRLPDVRA